MSLDIKLQRLQTKAVRALGSNTVEQALVKTRAIIGPVQIPNSESAAQTALEKLQKGQEPTAEEITALEIVVRLLRPVVIVQNGILNDLPSAPGHDLHTQEYKDLWSSFRSKISQYMVSIGRVEWPDQRHVGTGFLVADGILATNRHVLGVLTSGSEILDPGKCQVAFKREHKLTNATTDFAKIMGVAAIHPKLDIVLLSVTKQNRPPLPIETASVSEGEQVATIGFSGKDAENNPLFLHSVFDGKFGVKCAALGEVLDGTGTPNLFHDCSTTRGNSGSPIFSLHTGRVAGIHRAGFFMYRNEAIDAKSLQNFVAKAAA